MLLICPYFAYFKFFEANDQTLRYADKNDFEFFPHIFSQCLPFKSEMNLTTNLKNFIVRDEEILLLFL